jgi:hypothetical protein
LGDHILKAYAKQTQFHAARKGLLESGTAPALCTPGWQAALEDLRLTVQAVVDGATPADAVGAAGMAGAFVRTLQDHEFEGLAPAGPERQLSEAKRHAHIAATIAPDLVPALDGLTDRLEQSLPASLPLVAAHGDFHVDQLIANDERLMVIDFDGMCRAPAALDLATYAADVVRGREGDLDRVLAALKPLCDAYGSPPDAIEWYLSTAILCRATHPFRSQAHEWPERVRAMVNAAEEVLG